MKLLPTTLKKNGFIYTQIKRDGNACLYAQQVAENLQYFEVFIPKVKAENVYKGKTFPEREVFPYDEDFGKSAWSCRTLEDALIRFNLLLSKNS